MKSGSVHLISPPVASFADSGTTQGAYSVGTATYSLSPCKAPHVSEVRSADSEVENEKTIFCIEKSTFCIKSDFGRKIKQPDKFSPVSLCGSSLLSLALGPPGTDLKQNSKQGERRKRDNASC